MTEYLQYQFTDSPEFVSTFDEVPFWSASFGQLLLKYVQLKPNLTVLDIGSGAGFPLLELAQRLGTSCKCYGLDPWTHANDRARQKIKNYRVNNVEVLDCSADRIPFDDASVDLIVSNLGINNFENPDQVFSECHRVLRPGARVAITTNLNGHWHEFYKIFEDTLTELERSDLLIKLKQEQEHRGTVASISDRFAKSGLPLSRCFEEQFEMNFLNGTAFLNHYFVKLGWLSSWRELIPEADRVQVFTKLEQNLNLYAKGMGSLKLTVPMAFIEGKKV